MSNRGRFAAECPHLRYGYMLVGEGWPIYHGFWSHVLLDSEDVVLLHYASL